MKGEAFANEARQRELNRIFGDEAPKGQYADPAQFFN